MFIINYFFVLKCNVIYVNNGNSSIFKLSILILLVLEGLLFYTITQCFKKNITTEKLFLILGIIFGSLFMFLMPIGSVPDETNHFLRSYEISTGRIIGIKKGNEVGDYLPTNIEKAIIYNNSERTYKKELNNINIKINNEKKFYNFANTSLYSFVSYIPQSLGILVGRIFHLPIIIIAYLGRIFNFVSWLLITYLAIKKIPVGKMLVLLISLLPMSIQEAISLAPDAMTNCISIALISFVLYHVYNKRKLLKKDIVLATILCTAISLLKIVYLPLCLIILLIPYDKFKSKKDKYIIIGLMACFVVALNLIWLKISSNFLIEFMPGVNSSKQTSYILHHPYSYLRVVFSTYEYHLPTYIYTMLGSNLEWLNVYVSQPYLLVMLFLILYVALFNNDVILKPNIKCMFAFVSICIVVLISTSLYVQWTSYRYLEISGIQGRYFIPILLPLLLLLNNNKVKKNTFDSKKIVIFATSLNIYVVLLLMYTHLS